MRPASFGNIALGHCRGAQFCHQSEGIDKISSNNENVEEAEMCQQQGSLELMIRAHQKIRTLEEGNEILRKHVQLLSKDNEELGGMVQRMSRQKNQWLKQKQRLGRKVKDLEIKIDGYIVKERLHNMEKQNMGRNIKLAGGSETGYDKQADGEQNSRKFRPDTQKKGQKMLVQQIQHHHQIHRNRVEQMSSSMRGQLIVRSINNQQTDAGERVLNKNASCFLLKRQEKTHLQDKAASQHNCRPTRNYSSQALSRQHQWSGSMKAKDIGSTNNFRSSAWKTTGYKPTGNEEGGTQENFYLAQRHSSTSSLIRKNSPQRTKNAECQFHPQTWSEEYAERGGVGKKFNYTSWRKTNNNSLVWQGKGNSIVINR